MSEATYWSNLINLMGSGENPFVAQYSDSGGLTVTTSDGTPVLVLPGSDGRMPPHKQGYSTAGALGMQVLAFAKNPNVVKQWQKALNLPATGVVDNELVTRYVAIGNEASARNYAYADQARRGLLDLSKVKPYTILSLMKELGPSGVANVVGGGGRSGGGTSVSKSYQTYSRNDARALLEQYYGETLGRRPTAKEVKKFHAVLSNAAKKNPNVTKTTYSGSNSSSVSSGGFSQADASMLARQQAEEDPGAANFLNSTKYLDMFMSAIGSRVGL